MGKNILILLLAVFMGGCVMLPIPHKECEQPEIKGVVLDEDGVAIQNVNIEIKLEKPDIVLNATTNSNGEFYLPPDCKREIWYFLAMDPYFIEMTLSLSHSGYEEKRVVCHTSYRKTKVVDFGSITLKSR